MQERQAWEDDLSNALDVPFVELNRLIEADYGANIGELLALAGQPAFRRHERRCLEQAIAAHDHAVIATGGGIVTEPGTFSTLLAQLPLYLAASNSRRAHEPGGRAGRHASHAEKPRGHGGPEVHPGGANTILRARRHYVFDTSDLDEDEAANGLCGGRARVLKLTFFKI